MGVGRPPKPMRAVTGDLPTDDAGWTYEIKWDGFRTLADVDGGRLRLYSSNGLDITAERPELAGLAEAVNAGQALLDGELVAFDAEGRPRFELLGHRGGSGPPVTYVVFDLLELDGHDLTELALRDRRRLLERVLEPGPHWLVSRSHDDGAALAAATAAQGLEGVMAKRLDSPYLPGRRSPTWRKVKHRRRQELVIGGWTAGSGNRQGTLGALLVGYQENGRLRYGGGVGTGFSNATLDRLHGLLGDLGPAPCPFDPPPTPTQLRHQRPHWVRPELVCEVEFGDWTSDGIVRHASFLGLRADKDPATVVREPS